MRPTDFYLVVQAIKRVFVYDQKEHSYKTSSLVLKWDLLLQTYMTSYTAEL